MATQVQLRRGTAAENNAFTGAQGEVTVDTTNDTLRVHDGSQAGGYEIAKSDSQAHTNIDINSGTIDGVTLGTNSAVTEAQVDNININGNAITSTDTNGNIALTPDGTGEVDISKVDIDSGTIDDTTIGGSTPAAGSFTTGQFDTSLNVDGTVTADGLTVDTAIDVEINCSNSFDGIKITGSNVNGAGGRLQLLAPGASGTGRTLAISNDSRSSFDEIKFQANTDFAFSDFDTGDNRFRIADNGDISFYEDTGTTPKLFWDASAESLGIGTSSPSTALDVTGTVTADLLTVDGTGASSFTSTNTTPLQINGASIPTLRVNNTGGSVSTDVRATTTEGLIRTSTNHPLVFGTNQLERMRIDSSGAVFIGRTTGLFSETIGLHVDSTSSGSTGHFNRVGDGGIVRFGSDGTEEGSVSISGTTVSYNGGHLARWSRLLDDSKDTSIVKGTVMTNLDAMVVWSHDAVEAQEAVYDEEGNLVSEAVEAKEAYTEDNEQLNKMAVSSVEGDPNVAGVFVSWDTEDDFNDFTVAMTGDMVIRIAQDTTVQRGDLLMSAGDGTAKPQGDDIVRSKTIAKVTSTHVSHTYDDGSYLVPCVLMAC